MHGPTPSPLATLEDCFRLLSRQPGALAIDGALLQSSLPARPIPLDELRGRLHHLNPHARAAVVAVLVRRAREGSAAWQVGLAGVLLPGLRHLATQHATTNPTAADEAHALTWFRTALDAHSPVGDRRIRWLLDATCAIQRSRPAALPPPVGPSQRRQRTHRIEVDACTVLRTASARSSSTDRQ